eukprot:Gregarina_sp_Poly_1__357@NODE_1086_length_5140_cov_448_935344_g288_i1_p3_GENE_NODE_1086_length_5140_cov_448_935344_g288_i1NODE_1086_length_5140_cov_448_935344_g288_i1_p3_ORF_typecomplete_len270_score35_24_NODE_1086_length_5140_cov_448_935344_g288_i143305070
MKTQYLPSQVARYTATASRPPRQAFTLSDSQTVYTPAVEDSHLVHNLAGATVQTSPTPPAGSQVVYVTSSLTPNSPLAPMISPLSPKSHIASPLAQNSVSALPTTPLATEVVVSSVTPGHSRPPVPGTHYMPPMCEYLPPHKLQPGIQPSYSPYKVPVFVEKPMFEFGKPSVSKLTTLHTRPKQEVRRPPSASSSSTTVSNSASHRVIQQRGGSITGHHNLYVESEPIGEPSLDWDYRKPHRRACC